MTALGCPRCSEPLGERFVGTARVDVCDACAGVWLDAEALAVVCPTLSHLPQRPVEAALTGTRGTGLAHCPRCEKPPVEIRVLDVAVDFCTSCHGVWLDAGEYGETDDARDATNSPPAARSTYRSSAEPQAGARSLHCAYCTTEITPETSFMRERGFACARCHYALEQRVAALRAEPDALTSFLRSIADSIE